MLEKLLVFIVLTFGLMCSSGNYNTLMVKAEKKLYDENQPLEASRILIPNVNQRNQDQLLFMMEAGYMLHAAGDYEKSNKILQAADEKAEQMYKSVSKEVAAFITNETGKDYMGEDYERVLLNMTIGINFLMLGDFENAQVEFKKVNNKLEFIQEKSGKKYQLNLMALYLSAVAHAATGENEYAYVELKKIDKIQPGLPAVGLKLLTLSRELGYEDDYAQWKSLYNVEEKPINLQPGKKPAELVIIYESGLSPRKESRGKLLADPELNAMFKAAVVTAMITSGGGARAISNQLVLSTVEGAEHPIPRYVKQNYEITSARFDVMNQGRVIKGFNLQQMNNVEGTILTNFEEHYLSIRQKMITRLATKVVATLVSKAAAEAAANQIGGRRYGGIAGFLVGTLTGMGVGAALFSSEKPDLRCWHSIPAIYEAGSVLLPQGNYQGKITFFNRGGAGVSQQDIADINATSEKPQILLFRTYK